MMLLYQVLLLVRVVVRNLGTTVLRINALGVTLAQYSHVAIGYNYLQTT